MLSAWRKAKRVLNLRGLRVETGLLTSGLRNLERQYSVGSSEFGAER